MSDFGLPPRENDFHASGWIRRGSESHIMPKSDDLEDSADPAFHIRGKDLLAY